MSAWAGAGATGREGIAWKVLPSVNNSPNGKAKTINIRDKGIKIMLSGNKMVTSYFSYEPGGLLPLSARRYTPLSFGGEKHED